MEQPGTLVKIGEQKHVNRLHEEGDVFMNTLSYFWKIEDQEIRGDPNDGVSKLYHGPTGLVSKLDGTQIPVTVANWTLRIHPKDAGETNVFCMYAIRESSFPIDERALRFGDSAIIFTNPQQFIDRVTAGLKEQKAAHRANLVEYVANDDVGNVGPFRKLERFSWQSEWRLVAYGGQGTPRSLSIGSLRDISVVVPTSELNDVAAEYFEEVRKRRASA